MAEVIGTVAAVFQLVETAFKVKRICSEIGQMPKALTALVEEISLQAELFDIVQKRHIEHYDTLADSQIWKRYNEQLTAAVLAMQTTASQLEGIAKTHKRTGAIRIYFKREELAELQDQLERVKTTMVIAQQTYSFALITQQNSLLLKEIRSVIMDKEFPLETSPKPIGQTPSSAGAVTETKRRAAEEISSRNLLPDCSRIRSRKRRSSYRLNLPSWIYQTGLQILLDRSRSNWSVSIRTFNQVPRDSEMFVAARRDDWHRVQVLIREGQASPFDYTPDRESLLHLAVRNLNLDACKLLLEYQLDPSSQSDLENDAFQELSLRGWRSCHLNARALRTISDIFRLLTNAAFGGIFDQDDIGILQRLEPCSLEAAATMTGMVYPSYEKGISRLRRATTAVLSGMMDPRIVTVLLGNDQDLEQAFSLLEATGSPFHRILFAEAASKLGFLYSQPIRNEAFVQGWIDILRQIVRFESRCVTPSEFFSGISSFLTGWEFYNYENYYYHGLSQTIESYWTTIIQVWISQLQSLGVDLVRYGFAETMRWKGAAKTLPPIHFPVFGYDDPLRFAPRYITTGPSVEDWRLFAVPIIWLTDQESDRSYSSDHTDLYTVAGQFWNVVENPELFNIPGAFHAEPEAEYIGSSQPAKLVLPPPCL